MVNNIIVFVAKDIGFILVALLLIFVWQTRKQNFRIFFELAVSSFLSRGIITEVIRFFWHRNRPFVEMHLTPLIPHIDESSFPSGHATFFFALGTILYFYNKRLGVIFLAGSALMGIARVLALVHWPSDIVAGAVIGVVSAIATRWIFKKIKNSPVLPGRNNKIL